MKGEENKRMNPERTREKTEKQTNKKKVKERKPYYDYFYVTLCY